MDKMAYIARAIKEGRYRYTLHGAKQRIARGLKRNDLEEATTGGTIIEDYPDHHYGSACLVMGRTKNNKVLHVLYSLREIVDIITVYEPDLKDWENDFITRRVK